MSLIFVLLSFHWLAVLVTGPTSSNPIKKKKKLQCPKLLPNQEISQHFVN